jgi:hypothetical protein
MNRHLQQRPQPQHQQLLRQSHQQRQLHYRESRLEPQQLQVKKVGRTAQEERHHLPVHQELPQFLGQQELRRDQSEQRVLQEQLGLQVQLGRQVQLVQVREQQVLEEPLALEEPPAELVELDPVRHLLQN